MAALAHLSRTGKREQNKAQNRAEILTAARQFFTELGDGADPTAKPAHKGMSLILVEAGTPGFVRGKKLDKLGLRGLDTSELFFEDCRVPASNLLGQEGTGFKMPMEKLQQERLVIAITAIASCRRALDDTITYVRDRKAFGKSIASFQNTQFRLAELATEVEVGQSFVDRLLPAHVRGDDIVTEVSMAKWWTTDLQKKVTSECRSWGEGAGPRPHVR